MNHKAISKIVSRIGYKPGFEITMEGGKLRITYTTECAYQKGGVICANTIYGDFPGCNSATDVVEYIYYKLLWFEQHELDEWFEYNKIKLCNPHADDELNPRNYGKVSDDFAVGKMKRDLECMPTS